jgi:hypothetical protein
VENHADELKLPLIYPNPAYDLVTISSHEAIEKIVVFNLEGQVIMDLNFVELVHGEINVSKLTSGFYIIQFQKKNGNISKVKLVKM